MTNKRGKRHPVLLSHVVKAITELKEQKGSSISQIMDQVRSDLNLTNLQPKPRNVVMQVRRALKHAVDNGMLVHRAGKYKVVGSRRRAMPVDSVEHYQTCKGKKGRRRRRSRSRGRRGSRVRRSSRGNHGRKRRGSRRRHRSKKGKSTEAYRHRDRSNSGSEEPPSKRRRKRKPVRRKSDDYEGESRDHSENSTGSHSEENEAPADDKDQNAANKNLKSKKSIPKHPPQATYEKTMHGDDKKEQEHAQSRKPRARKPPTLPGRPQSGPSESETEAGPQQTQSRRRMRSISKRPSHRASRNVNQNQAPQLSQNNFPLLPNAHELSSSSSGSLVERPAQE